MSETVNKPTDKQQIHTYLIKTNHTSSPPIEIPFSTYVLISEKQGFIQYEQDYA